MKFISPDPKPVPEQQYMLVPDTIPQQHDTLTDTIHITTPFPSPDRNYSSTHLVGQLRLMFVGKIVNIHTTEIAIQKRMYYKIN